MAILITFSNTEINAENKIKLNYLIRNRNRELSPQTSCT